MKTIVKLFPVFLVLIALNSCDKRHHEMVTRINPDGSCYRELTASVDSVFMVNDTAHHPFPVDLDTNWMVTFTKKTPAGNETLRKKFSIGKLVDYDTSISRFVTVHRDYSSVQEMDSLFKFANCDWSKVVPKSDLQKKFRWFYTYYYYTETYPKVNPFTRIPITNYVTNEEIQAYTGDNTDLFKGKIGVEVKDILTQIEGKINAWLNRSTYEEMFNFYLKYYRYLGDMPVDSATFLHLKDSIYKKIEDSTKYDNAYFASDLFDKYFKTKAYSEAKAPEEIEEKGEKELAGLFTFEDYFKMSLTNQLLMPGKVLETNTQVMKHDTLSWDLTAYRFFFNDYTLTAKSRLPNTWAFLLTGFLILIVFLSFFIKRK